ncbi:MAG: Rsd/AlgQ family anti-sigma factor [Halieaceae bacterium]|jgi:regulator of sigma D|nr:Rsd/AlgQ family anti-sigma factor [Halieaceae bacterium]
MLDDCKNSQETWQAVETMLQAWLRERREVLVKYTAIAATLDRDAPLERVNEGIERLCQILVDYVSAGHFEVFLALQKEAEVFADGSGEVAGELIPNIGDTTEVILGFEEKYPTDSLDDLDADLSLLGEMLETRFALEDRLIAILHSSHAAQLAAD